jgi:S1-C subfamily serine protease
MSIEQEPPTTPAPGTGHRFRPRRRHRVALLAGGLAVAGVAAASGSALAARTVPPQLTTAQIAAKTGPGLVDITATLGYQHAASAGTGLVATASGEVITNNHVVEGATAIKATDVATGRGYRALVIGYDRAHDIAVLQLRGAAGLKTVVFGSSAAVSPGQRVVALGNAGGKGGKPSVVTGRVKALSQSIVASDAAAGTSERLSGLIRTSAPIQPGDSGGPLVNSAGQVIGINTAASAGAGFRFQRDSAPTQAFAIPAARARSIADQIESRRSSATVHIGATAFLGVRVLSASEGTVASGAAVAGVLPGSPAALAGVSAGDAVTSVGGTAVTSPSGLQSVLTRYHPGDRVQLGWNDGSGRSHRATVTLVSGPAG